MTRPNRTNPKRPTRDQEIFTLLHYLRGLKATAVVGRAARRGYRIHPTTIYKLRLPYHKGGTRYPQRYTTAALAAACGMEYRLVRLGSNSFLPTYSEKNWNRGKP